jgi:hypothetical protein
MDVPGYGCGTVVDRGPKIRAITSTCGFLLLISQGWISRRTGSSTSGCTSMSLRKVTTNHFRFLAAFGVLCGSILISGAACAISAPLIVPLHAKVHWDASRARDWKTYVYSSSSEARYVLWLFPQYEVGHHIVGLDLVLNETGHEDWNENLLAPKGNWHGLEPFMLTASELADGTDGMNFGPRIRIPVKEKGLIVAVDVLGAKVDPFRNGDPNVLPHGDYEFKELDLSISVENLRPKLSSR